MVLILTKIETELNLIYYSPAEAGILAAQGGAGGRVTIAHDPRAAT